MNNKVDFSTGNVRRNIISMALPMLIAQLFNILYSVVDRIYIGNLPEVGELALGGIGICVPIITVFTGFTNLFGLGGAPLFSIARGRGDKKEAAKILHNAFIMLLCTGIILGLAVYIFRKPLLYLLGATDATYVYADDYLSIYLSGTCASMISLGMNPYINSQGFARTGMLTVIVGALLNFVLDPIFIFGLDMGVKGAAVATVVSQLVSAVWVIHFLTGQHAENKLQLSLLVPDLKCILGIVKLGTASFIMSGTDSLVQIVCNRMLLNYGGDLYIGIMTIINSVRQIVLTPVSAITDGASSVISFNFGADRLDKVKHSIRFMSVLAVGYSIMICGLIALVPEVFMKMFTKDSLMLSEGSIALKLYFSGFFMMALQYSGQSVFKSLNMAGNAIFFSLFRKVVVVVPLTICLPMFLGVKGVYYAEVASNYIGGGICFATMLFVVSRLNKQRKLKENIFVSAEQYKLKQTK
ncbi:MAG: MATE family efflux transporter [Lachnospiraceae bacterium]|nr:MATE family efflux transporter [Lachnospiraceae bacterium]